MPPGENESLSMSAGRGSTRSRRPHRPTLPRPGRRLGPASDLQVGPAERRQARPAVPADRTGPANRSEAVPGTARPRICVVVPAFNEAASIARVVSGLALAVPDAHVVVVNDGSEDDTAARALGAGATVMTLPVNLGIGGAVQAGYRYALRHGYDVAVQVDGDDQHDPFEIERLIAPIRADRAEMTVGSRWLGRGEYVAPRGRRLGMRLLARLVHWRTGCAFTDTTSGFRALGRDAIALFARIYPTDFPEVESLVLASRNGLRLEEVAVRMIPRTDGRSSISGIRSAYYLARVTAALAVGSLNRTNGPSVKEAT